MINQDTILKLQACLDQELSEREAREVAALVEKDTEARALYAELSDTKRLLDGNELLHKLPESREFYWSKIERAIAREETKPQPTAILSRYPRWLRYFAPALGGALLLMMAVSVLKLSTAPTRTSYLHEIETPLEETSAISFHSQSAGVTVVWVQTKGVY